MPSGGRTVLALLRWPRSGRHLFRPVGQGTKNFFDLTANSDCFRWFRIREKPALHPISFLTNPFRLAAIQQTHDARILAFYLDSHRRRALERSKSAIEVVAIPVRALITSSSVLRVIFATAQFSTALSPKQAFGRCRPDEAFPRMAVAFAGLNPLRPQHLASMSCNENIGENKCLLTNEMMR